MIVIYQVGPIMKLFMEIYQIKVVGRKITIFITLEVDTNYS